MYSLASFLTLPTHTLGLGAILLLSLIGVSGLGVWLIPMTARESFMKRIPLALSSGLVFAVGVISTVMLGRFNYLSVIPVAQLLLVVVWQWQKLSLAAPTWVTEGRSKFTRQDLVALAVLVLGCFLHATFYYQWLTSEGKIQPLNMDLGYFAQLALGVPEAGVATAWSATLGAMTQASGETKDVWYHWQPVWLLAFLHKVTGFSTIQLLTQVVAPLLDFILVLTSGQIVQRLTGWSLPRCLLVGAVSLVALTFPSMSEVAWLARTLPGDAMSHVHVSLAYQFSYKAEAVLVMAAIYAWLSQRTTLAALLVCIAAISAPHTVAGGGLMAGMLGLAGLVRRDWRQVQLAASIIGLLILGWAVVHFGFGVGMPKSDSAKFIELDVAKLLHNFGKAWIDILCGLLLATPILPGVIHLIRDQSSRANEQTRSLGWMALASLSGGYLAYAMLLPDGDRAHFTMYAHAFFVLPIGCWGLASLAQNEGLRKLVALSLFVTTALIGSYDLWKNREPREPSPYTFEELQLVQRTLHGQPFGYFAKQDRNWWISKYAGLASHLQSRCVRLNKIESNDLHTEASRFYGSSRPEELCVPLAGESPEAWSLRFASKLGVRFVLETGDDAIPAAVLGHLREVVAIPGMKLFEVQ
jgi:hypothetical protein